MTDVPEATSLPTPQTPAAAESATRPTASLHEGRSDAAGAEIVRHEGSGDGADAGASGNDGDGGTAEAGAATGAPRARRSRGGRGRRRSGQAGPKAAGTADDATDTGDAEGIAAGDPIAGHQGDRAGDAPADADTAPGSRRGDNSRRRPDAARPPRRPAQAQAQAQPKGQPQQQPSRNKVHPVLQRLFELYPSMFGARFLPLKLGVYQDLLERHGDEFKAEDLKIALGLHARSTRYLDAVAAGHPRHDLDAQPVEPVAPEHVHHAILEVFRRRQSRTPEDLGGALRDRIIAAIEASGIGRDAYAERVRARDVNGNAALDDALAELGRRGAKREALLRAFEASGRTEAEFADMYGMEPREVTRTLQRARKDRVLEAEAAARATAAAAAAEAEGAPAEAGEQEMQDVEDVQDVQDARGVDDMQDAQDAPTAGDMEDPSAAKDVQEARHVSSSTDTPDADTGKTPAAPI